MSGVGGAPVGAWTDDSGLGVDLYDSDDNLVGWVWRGTWFAWRERGIAAFAEGFCLDMASGMRTVEAELHAAGVTYCTLGPAGVGGGSRPRAGR